jgi:UDP-glucose 4-epimerase
VKALVTGASGFIGSHLCRQLCQQQAEVHAVSRTKEHGRHDDIQWWRGDVADEVSVRELVSAIKPDVIFHLAGHVAGARELEHVRTTFRSNLMSAVNLLSAASEVGRCRVILTGSLEEPDPSEALPVPCSPYAAAKWAASGYARMFHALYGLDVVILRVFMVYGPGQTDLQKLIPYAILRLLRGESPKLSSGQRLVDWIYVDDVVEGYLAAARAKDVAGQTVDIGSGSLESIRAVVERLGRQINPAIPLHFGALPDRPLEQVRVADTKQSKAIGWQPATSLEDGLARTVAWYRQQWNRDADAGSPIRSAGQTVRPKEMTARDKV